MIAASSSSSSSSQPSPRSNAKAALWLLLLTAAAIGTASWLPTTVLASSHEHNIARQAPPLAHEGLVERRRRAPAAVKRQASGADQAGIASQGETDPLGAAEAAISQPGIKQNYSGSDSSPYSWTTGTGDGQQLPWNDNVYLQPSAATNGSEDGGWQELPDTPGFILNRSLTIPNSDNTGAGIMPFYITENTMNPSAVKRAIMVWPGKPRDAWNYANLMLNARSVVAENFAEWGITNDSVLILAPVFMDEQDVTAGAGHQGEIAFGGELWQQGSTSHLPVLNNSISSYAIMDFFADMLFDKAQYPNLNQVVIAGHSLGGQASMRYSLMKKTKFYDQNMRYWMGNPGSWTWLSDQRPYPNANGSCATGTTGETLFNSWPYGLNGNQSAITKYARKNVEANQTYVIERFLGRSVHYALALLDSGAGTTGCAAQWQGANHLDRGASFILAYQNLSLSNYGFPANHTVDFIANTSHQDYPMYSANQSLIRLFQDGFDVRNPDLVNLTNPGEVTHVNNPTGAKAFATPLHEKVAIGLLAGPIGLVIILYCTFLWTFTNNYDPSWEKEEKVPSGNLGRMMH